MMMGMRFGRVPNLDGHIEDEEVIEVGGLKMKSRTRRGTLRGIFRSTSRTKGSCFRVTRCSREAWAGWTCPAGSMEILLWSIGERLLPLPDETHVYSGHGPRDYHRRGTGK